MTIQTFYTLYYKTIVSYNHLKVHTKRYAALTWIDRRLTEQNTVHVNWYFTTS